MVVRLPTDDFHASAFHAALGGTDIAGASVHVDGVACACFLAQHNVGHCMPIMCASGTHVSLLPVAA